MPSNGLLYESGLVAPSPILCRSWVFFNNIGQTYAFADTNQTYETPYGGAESKQGILSCLTSFMPPIKSYHWMLENTAPFPSDTPFEVTTPSVLKKCLEHFSEHHIDGVSLGRFKHDYFTLLTDFGCVHMHDGNDPTLKGYLMTTPDRRISFRLEFDQQLKANARLNVLIYLEGPKIIAIKPNSQVYILD